MQGAPLRRSCGQRTKYMFCRTWFFEVIFTFVPCALLALILAGIYEYEEVSREITTSQLYEHSMAPVTVALRAFMDRKLRALDHLTAFVEGGGWSDTADFEPVAMQILPYFSRNEAHRTAGLEGYPSSDEVEVGYYTADTMAFAEFGNPSTRNFVSSAISQAFLVGPSRTTRDRFVDFSTQAPGLGLYPPNVSRVTYTDQPWEAVGTLNNDETLFAFAAIRGLPSNSYGLRFQALHQRVVAHGSTITTAMASEIFMTYNRTRLFSDMLPPCASHIHAVIYDVNTNQLVWYNCAANVDFPPASITDVPFLEQNLHRSPWPAHVRVTSIEQFAILQGGLYHLATINMVPGATAGSEVPAEKSWSGHNRADAAIGNRVFAERTLAVSVKNFIAARMTTQDEIDLAEEFYAGLIISNPYLDTVYQLLPTRTAGFRILTLYTVTTNVNGQRIFRAERFDPEGRRNQIINRDYATDRLECVPEPSDFTTQQGCVARRLLENGTTSFLAGFNERVINYALPPGNFEVSWLPTWARHAIEVIGNPAAAPTSPIMFDPTSVAAGRVTMIRTARLPTPPATAYYSDALKPPYVFLRQTYPLSELTGIMTTLLGKYVTGGRMRILNGEGQLIAIAGSRTLNVQDEVSGSLFRTLVKPQLETPCSRSSDNLVCDVATRTPLVFMYEKRENALRTTMVAFSKFTTWSTARDAHVSQSSWFVSQTLPGELITTFTETEKIVGGAAVFAAVVFLVINVIFICYSSKQVVDLKRYMRALSRNQQQLVDPSLSSNTELREIQLSLRKLRRAVAEYSQFLPQGLITNGLNTLEEEEATATAVVDSVRAGNAYAVRDVVNAANGTGAAANEQDAEMTAVAPGGTAASVAVTEEAEARPQSYDDILFTHQVGIARRSMAVLSLEVSDDRGFVKRRPEGQVQLQLLMRNLYLTFAKRARVGGGMLIPCGSGAGAMCAVWSHGASRKAHKDAAMAALLVANHIAADLRQNHVPFGRFGGAQVSIAVGFGAADIGTIGQKDGRKTAVFAGEAFDRTRALHRVNARALKRAGCQPAPAGAANGDGDDRPRIVGCPVAATCDEAIVAETLPHFVLIPDLEGPHAHIVSVLQKQATQVANGRSEPDATPELRLAEALRSNVRPDAAMVRELLSQCKAPIIAGCTRPVALLPFLE